MEIEYKWSLAPHAAPFDDAIAALGVDVSAPTKQHMRAVYYDTDDGLIARLHGGLRLRSENNRSVCCLKLSAHATEACKAREEFEIEADDIRAGIAALSAVGAPADICEKLLERTIAPLCETEFDRTAWRVTREGAGGFTAELAVDTGALRREGREGPISEVELEYLRGSEETFHAFARDFARTCGLTPQPLSKLARAMRL